MSARLTKFIALVMAAALLVGVSFIQRSITADRGKLGLTRLSQPLENAPPVLAFTTVALGGFRGLIANALWIRMTDLQDNDRFFEMQQLADWITKLEPHFAQVWVNQAWNMSYNISVKFKDYEDRWRWVQAGIELLRDEGLKYNPNDPLIHRELAWHFQHKMGANLDDANMVYKSNWAREMTNVFGGDLPNFDELANPQTDDARARAQLLREKYKMDPLFMMEVDRQYGPLEWRLPEAHAIYWAADGLRKAGENPTRVDKHDLTQLRRAIYQSMQLSYQRGKLVRDPFLGAFDFGPNLDIFPKVNAAYNDLHDEEPDPAQKSGIRRAQRNLIKDAVVNFYVHNRKAEASYWYDVLKEKYPNNNLLESRMDSFPHTMTYEEFSIAMLTTEIKETSREKIRQIVGGFVLRAYEDLVLGDDERSALNFSIARKALENFQRETKTREMALRIPPIEDVSREILQGLLDPQTGAPPEIRAILRTKLKLGPEPPPEAPANASTNTPAIPPP